MLSALFVSTLAVPSCSAVSLNIGHVSVNVENRSLK
jgi:hypothetical protein